MDQPELSPRRAALAALAAHIAQRRDALMEAWRCTVDADPKLTTGASLPRAQLHDHIPALLQDFEQRLVAGGAQQRAEAEDDQLADAAAHGLHRWQQGFDLGEVTRELGRLNGCVVVELDSFAEAHVDLPAGVMAKARKVWADLYGIAVSSSTSQYFRLQQLEAAGHVKDLERALESLRELDAQRSQLWQQAAHDLRGNLGVVANASAGLHSTKASVDARDTFLRLLDRNVAALHRLLEDVTGLARLQGGQEHRNVAPMDATALLQDIGESLQPFAQEQNLDLRVDGPVSCLVEGDAIKIRRVVQNLVLNALKYTQQGGVTLRWGDIDSLDAQRWFVQIKDTGPGFHAGPGAKIAAVLEVATDQSREIAADAVSGDVTHVSQEQPNVSRQDDQRSVHQQAGEGLGLSIVKRLCELLDATIELDSAPGVGTTFRILLPKKYVASAAEHAAAAPGPSTRQGS